MVVLEEWYSVWNRGDLTAEEFMQKLDLKKSHPGSSKLPSPYPAPADHVYPKTKKRMYQSAPQMVDKLRRLIESDPNASQKEYAKQLGISQGHVSQLKKLL
ncbi:hypothetical protein [Paenibacillus polymyxa]|uniref:hypothetical protein n=1 Tax=Paenibacillus polymyxa TaxID=1406 RepID=UPI000AE42F7E|nr:hypothetical protein [Paenibacillus polymyxa]